MRMRALLIGAAVVVACTAPPSTATLTPTSAPNVAVGTPTRAATQTPFPTSTFAVDASAQWPVVLYEGEGFIVSQRTESGTKELARPCGPITKVEARPAGLLAMCRTTSGSAELRLISIPDGRVSVLASGIHPSWNADVSPDGRSAAAFRSGACPSPAPVCQTRAVLIDIASGTEREILPSGYHLGATIEWTALGLTLFQPECAEAGCAGPGDRSGTFVWDGSAFKKWHDLRFVARSGDWTLLERVRSLSDRDAPRTTFVRGPQGEKELSAGNALAISTTGETLVWVPGPRLLTRLAPDGRVVWQAAFDSAALEMVGPDSLLAVSPSSTLEIYDLKRMLRFAPATPIPYAVAGVAR
jgi:hypothetical protein